VRLFWICLGGAFGTGARYLLGGFIDRATGSAFPFGTLAINASGSFLIAVIMELAAASTWVPPELRLALTTGVMGGYTTYSTFNYETLRLLEQGAWLLGAANLAATVAGCLAAGLGGLLLARAIV
jgi:CrcB protein